MAASPIPSLVASETNGELRNRVQQLRLDERLGQVGSGRGATGVMVWLPWTLCILMALTWAGIALRSYRTSPAANSATEGMAATSSSSNASSAPAAPTSALSGSSSSTPSSPPPPGTVVLENKGYLAAAQKIAVSPIDIGGRLIELNVIEGNYYEQGTVLAKIDPASYQAAVDEAEAALAAAQQRLIAAQQRREELKPYAEKKSPIRELEIRQLKAQVEEAKAQQQRTADEYRRIAPLAGSSPREVEVARNELLAAEARVAKLEADLEVLIRGPREEKLLAAEADVRAAESEVAAAKARLTQAKWRLGNCEIVAPISGTVLTKKAERFNLVNPMAFGATSGSVCDMADLSDLEVEIDVAERDISKLQVNMPCRIRVDAYKDRIYEGYLHRIQPIANRGNSVVPVRVKVLLPDDEKQAGGTRLKPEMGAVVSFMTKPKP